MLTRNLLTAFLLFIMAACQKEISFNQAGGLPVQQSPWIIHTIAKGVHDSDKNQFKAVDQKEMKFLVKFDSSAIYQTVDPDNQGDINKLYGFSDNNQEHHTNSARIGWRWFNNQLELWGYTYNNAVRIEKLITAVSLNQEINCSIKAEGSLYTFKVQNTLITMSRTATTSTAIGYQLYPYFGGDEPSPHEIKIQIKDLK